ncbi:hypothetical protein ILYODFUR_014103 [Ilyodon furcidens]|uniref:Uncharacterized protein n=1 Tax=Ilyodon furcidens TaxID=33524 RepID=A0ABV0URU8_9TELE
MGSDGASIVLERVQEGAGAPLLVLGWRRAEQGLDPAGAVHLQDPTGSPIKPEKTARRGDTILHHLKVSCISSRACHWDSVYHVRSKRRVTLSASSVCFRLHAFFKGRDGLGRSGAPQAHAGPDT